MIYHDPPQVIFNAIRSCVIPSLIYKGGDQGVGHGRSKTVTYVSEHLLPMSLDYTSKRRGIRGEFTKRTSIIRIYKYLKNEIYHRLNHVKLIKSTIKKLNNQKQHLLVMHVSFDTNYK
jgi:hypothetical protein